MPHFIVDCSEPVLRQRPPRELILAIHDAAEATELFDARDIKVRIRAYTEFTVARGDADFIHVFAHIMQGRTVAQRADLSRRIVAELVRLYPDVPVISMNVTEFEKATYCNRQML